jgi:hypothetical protein
VTAKVARQSDGITFPSTVSIPVYVFTQQSNPLVGYWTEVKQFACGTGIEVIPEDPILELRLRADAKFDVTRNPFETYHDYQGFYEYDLQEGTIKLNADAEHSFYLPKDIDNRGTFSFNDQGPANDN